MTLAAETVLAREAALAYAAVCSVDNLANGVSDEPLTVEEYRRGRDRNRRGARGRLWQACCRRSPPRRAG